MGYWTTNNGEPENKEIMIAKLAYLFFLLYFFIIGLIGWIRDDTWGSIFVAIILPLFMLFLIIGDILHYYRHFIRYTKPLSNLFSKIIHLIKRIISESKKDKIPPKVAIKRLTYVFFFFMIPIAFMFLIVNGQWQYATTYTSSGGNFGNIEGHHQEIEKGIVNIKPTLEKDYRIKLSYFLGDVLNIPIFDVCFINNGTTFINDTYKESFDSEVKLDNSSYSIPFQDKSCLEINMGQSPMEYEWVTEYKYSLKNRTSKGEIVDVSTQPHNYIKIIVNNNYWFMMFLVVVAWLAVCNLIYNVFKDLNDIK
jgi:hypothetical protein